MGKNCARGLEYGPRPQAKGRTQDRRKSNSDSTQKKNVLKNIRFSNYFMLVVLISLIKFSKIVFAV